MIWVGTCGFGRRQEEIFRSLHAVEIQASFYRPLSVERARTWRAAAPEAFLFTVKASQFITHPANSPTYRRSGRQISEEERPGYGAFQDSRAVQEGWEATRVVAAALRARAIVFQCPSSFGPTPEHLGSLYGFFESIRTEAVKAWEPRGPWASHLVDKVCEDLGLVHVVDPFAAEPATTGLAYFRLQGSPPGSRLYRYTYSDADLSRLRLTCEEYDDAFVMFNTFSMASDAGRFRMLLEGGAAH